MRTISSAALIVLILGTGCVGTHTTLQTAPTLKKGEARVTAGMSAPVSTRFVQELADVIKGTTDRVINADTDPLSEDEQREALEGATAALLLQPAVLTIVEGRYGLTDTFDMGLKWAGPAFRLDGKYWLHHSEGGLDASLSLGYTHHTGIGASVAEKAFDLFEYLELTEFSRKDLDAALLLSSNAKARFGYYGALRYAVGFLQIDTSFDRLMTEAPIEDTSVDDNIHSAGGTGGVRLKAGPVQLMAELTVMRMFFEPSLAGETVDLGGYLIEPAVGASVAF